MNEEIKKILQMLEDNKIDEDKAKELIELLKEEEVKEEKSIKLSTNNNKTYEYLDKHLKVKVKSSAGDDVNVNLPLKVIQSLFGASKKIFGEAIKIPQVEKALNGVDVKMLDSIDIELILEAIANEMEGPIVEVKSAAGDSVLVVIE